MHNDNNNNNNKIKTNNNNGRVRVLGILLLLFVYVVTSNFVFLDIHRYNDQMKQKMIRLEQSQPLSPKPKTTIMGSNGNDFLYSNNNKNNVNTTTTKRLDQEQQQQEPNNGTSTNTALIMKQEEDRTSTTSSSSSVVSGCSQSVNNDDADGDWWNNDDDDGWNNNTPITDEFPYPLTCNQRDLYEFLKRRQLISLMKLHTGMDEGEDCNNGGDDHRNITTTSSSTSSTTVFPKVAVAFHVGMVKNWKTIVHDQMTTFTKCGLFNIVNEIMISYSNGSQKDLLDVLYPMLLLGNANVKFDVIDMDTSTSTSRYDDYNNSHTNAVTSNNINDQSNHKRIKLTTVKATSKPWEGPAMNMIYEYCQHQNATKTTTTTTTTTTSRELPPVVFYFHNKGASKFKSNWKSQWNRSRTYSHSLYWRKYLEYFLIERPQLCLEELWFRNASTCGTNWHWRMKNHYSGNFWSSSCHHIVENLRPLGNSDTNYVAAEFWLGKVRKQRQPKPKIKHSTYFSTRRKLYQQLIMPEEYNTLLSNMVDKDTII